MENFVSCKTNTTTFQNGLLSGYFKRYLNKENKPDETRGDSGDFF